MQWCHEARDTSVETSDLGWWDLLCCLQRAKGREHLSSERKSRGMPRGAERRRETRPLDLQRLELVPPWQSWRTPGSVPPSNSSLGTGNCGCVPASTLPAALPPFTARSTDPPESTDLCTLGLACWGYLAPSGQSKCRFRDERSTPACHWLNLPGRVSA